jgi:phenylpropionate dioxygenase-like ring-hydroxylating dioxygenase large terminal subunit
MGHTTLNKPIVLFRDDAINISALEDRYCHLRIPLIHGKRVKSALECGYHGLVFNGLVNALKYRVRLIFQMKLSWRVILFVRSNILYGYGWGRKNRR